MGMNEEIARIAYHAYGETVGFKNFQGSPMPEFDDLPDIIQQAWENAAKTVMAEVFELHGNDTLDSSAGS